MTFISFFSTFGGMQPSVGFLFRRPFFHRLLQGDMEHHMDVADRLLAQTSTRPLVLGNAATGPQVLVHLLYPQAGQLFQRDITDVGDQVLFQEIGVLILGSLPEIRLGVHLKPSAEPLPCRILDDRLRRFLDGFNRQSFRIQPHILIASRSFVLHSVCVLARTLR